MLLTIVEIIFRSILLNPDSAMHISSFSFGVIFFSSTFLLFLVSASPTDGVDRLFLPGLSLVARGDTVLTSSLWDNSFLLEHLSSSASTLLVFSVILRFTDRPFTPDVGSLFSPALLLRSLSIFSLGVEIVCAFLVLVEEPVTAFILSTPPEPFLVGLDSVFFPFEEELGLTLLTVGVLASLDLSIAAEPELLAFLAEDIDRFPTESTVFVASTFLKSPPRPSVPRKTHPTSSCRLIEPKGGTCFPETTKSGPWSPCFFLRYREPPHANTNSLAWRVDKLSKPDISTVFPVKRNRDCFTRLAVSGSNTWNPLASLHVCVSTHALSHSARTTFICFSNAKTTAGCAPSAAGPPSTTR
mmetsp:Transcript_9533/g.17975  ORF Transcript_9533/g.17975 Transcript_9533/m.17975 type:complete len:356 (-) Transcript_9533:288-1355(-)